MDATVELKTTCSLGNVRRIGQVFESTLRAAVPDEYRAALEIALSEACVNIVKHGSGGREDSPLNVRLEVSHDRARLTIVDTGVYFDPRDHEVLKIENHEPSAIQTSGRGLLLIRELMDEIGYETEHGCNVLTLTKHLARAPEEGKPSEEIETQTAT